MSRVEYGAGPDLPPVSGWAISGIWFAASLMLLVGVFQVLGGLAQIIHHDFFVAGHHYAFAINVTAWGWFDLVLGIVIVCAGFALFAGRPWAAITALILAVLSAINNFLFIPYYPWWSLLMIAVDIWIVWALTRPGAIVAT